MKLLAQAIFSARQAWVVGYLPTVSAGYTQTQPNVAIVLRTSPALAQPADTPKQRYLIHLYLRRRYPW
jgi:hypothetical protein